MMQEQVGADVIAARLEAKHEERIAEKAERKAKKALLLDPQENANVFWQEYNEGKSGVMAKLESAEQIAAGASGMEADGGTGDVLSRKAQAAALLREAGDGVASLQAKAARASLFLPGYDQRVANDSVMLLYQAVAQSRDRVFPREAFRFKTRRSTPAELASLIAQLRREVGTTSGESHLQGHTDVTTLDPALSFTDRNGEVLVKWPGEIGGKDFVLSRLKNCTVFLCDTSGALRADRLEGCRVYVGPVRSCLMEKLDGCVFAIAAQQLRIHSAELCDFYVRMRSGPIIEHSSKLRFAPYNLHYNALEAQLQESNLAHETGLWSKVEDFNWLRAQHSPNWCIVPESERSAELWPPGEKQELDGDEM